MIILQLLIICLSAPLHSASALSSDGLTLLSLAKHWISVLPSLKSNWNSSDSTPCSWIGIQCDHYGNVIFLNLTKSGIFGQLGPEIGQLTHLQNLVLETNGFSGTIPLELGNCSMLEYIDLSDNYFDGNMPETLQKLQNLRYLSFSSNMLTGQIPDYLFQVPRLEVVDLHKNSLSGSIPSNIGNMTKLLKLYLSRNQLSGTVPSSIVNCSKLEALFVNDNMLTGILPQSLNNLNNLIYLDVKNNSLGGIIPLGFGSWGKLFILDLSFNVFSGGIPSGLGNCSSLAEFAAVKSNLVGSIPSSLGLLQKLLILRLPDNRLSGNIPPEIGNCKSLKKLHLYSNQLVGTIPQELGGLSKLEDLELYSNHLTGEIPLTIWKIQSLEHILLHNNSLFGKLPSEMTELKHLKNISLFDNQFSGSIPQNLGINSSLVKLDLMNNKFTGNIPPNLCFGKQLHLLNLGLNQLQGSIPHDLGRCATLGRLVLNKNNLSGPFPEFEGNQNLGYLDISRNNINGTIPSSLGNCTNLTALIMSTNNITGFIPSKLGNLVNLQVLNLAHNSLEGPLPHQLSYCTKMETFDVGFNFLNGSFPSSMRSWTGLTKLILRENRFSRDIPTFLSEYDQLLELQLGGNMFGGKIPTSMGSLQNLLYELNLSANKLTGEIPLEIGKLQKLQSLDISLNNLTGSLHVLDKLSSLREVNISYNSFVGPVPEWKMQRLNLSSSSFLGNPGLCVRCSRLNLSSCINYNLLKPCDSESTNHKGSKRSILFMALGFVGFVICLSGILVIYDRHSSQRSKKEVPAYPDEQIYIRQLRPISNLKDNVADYKEQEASYSNDEGDFRIIDLMNATENLSDQYIIGEGGHGIVYKAELDIGVFAIKKVKFGQSNRRKVNMVREIEMTRKIRHQNVARCLGSWIGEEYGLTISKYMENGSLHDVLHENDPLPYLEWNVRYKIAIGIAKGLAYLHHNCDPPVLHRDIKPKNILLDSDMQPCITDFGISIALNQSSTTVHMRSTYHLGTLGFMAPGIFVRRYGEFHLGSSLATAVASLFFQEEAKIPASRHYSSILHEAMEATANPNNLNVIGRGTHGVVYKVSLGPDLVYAVKKLAFAGNKGKIQSIVREIKILMNIRHRNLVGLLDFLFRENCGMLLYSYMTNGNLHDVLHEKNPPSLLGWTVRYRIAAGIAHGLAYLHYDCHPAILHRAIKPKNILLDYDMEPHIADFGIAKLLDVSSSSRSSSSVPENTYTTANTRESDVYSFGVVLFELITRKKAVDPSFKEGIEIVSWVRSLWQEARGIYKIIDSSLVEEVSDPNVLKRVINVLLVALRCTEEDPDMRPTMRDVIYQFKM
ncbi:receptor-like protein kinase isoform X4 [Prosopis cineraria]|uniref:receptor-like protein kinase isoform X4 n=1 Tax=Prosopis cineraria TaxID=364024 RepID=UPI00240EFEAA|nr:receptor-like protein kinase isoform X4 [Prosopis cineraria]